MSSFFAVRAHGIDRFRCVVCKTETARIALYGPGGTYGLCASSACIEAPDRDARLTGALPRGFNAGHFDINAAWCGVVHGAFAQQKAEAAEASGRTAPSRVIYAGPLPPESKRRRFDLG